MKILHCVGRSNHINLFQHTDLFLSSLYPESTPTLSRDVRTLYNNTDVPFYHTALYLTALFFTDSPREVYFIAVIKF